MNISLNRTNWMTMLLNWNVFNCHNRMVKYSYFVYWIKYTSYSNWQLERQSVSSLFLSFDGITKHAILFKCWAKQSRNRVFIECLVLFHLCFSYENIFNIEHSCQNVNGIWIIPIIWMKNVNFKWIVYNNWNATCFSIDCNVRVRNETWHRIIKTALVEKSIGNKSEVIEGQ